MSAQQEFFCLYGGPFNGRIAKLTRPEGTTEQLNLFIRGEALVVATMGRGMEIYSAVQEVWIGYRLATMHGVERGSNLCYVYAEGFSTITRPAASIYSWVWARDLFDTITAAQAVEATPDAGK